MKKIIFVFCVLATLAIALPTLASTLQIIGPCDSKPLIEIDAHSQAKNLGDFTVEEFEKNKIPFAGSRAGIQSIFDSPRGDEAMEILSDTQMRAYGWCVTVNGVASDQMPEDVSLHPNESVDVVWFYAFALYDRGEWKEFCTPSFKVRSLPACASSAVHAAQAELQGNQKR